MRSREMDQSTAPGGARKGDIYVLEPLEQATCEIVFVSTDEGFFRMPFSIEMYAPFSATYGPWYLQAASMGDGGARGKGKHLPLSKYRDFMGLASHDLRNALEQSGGAATDTGGRRKRMTRRSSELNIQAQIDMANRAAEEPETKKSTVKDIKGESFHISPSRVQIFQISATIKPKAMIAVKNMMAASQMFCLLLSRPFYTEAKLDGVIGPGQTMNIPVRILEHSQEKRVHVGFLSVHDDKGRVTATSEIRGMNAWVLRLVM